MKIEIDEHDVKNIIQLNKILLHDATMTKTCEQVMNIVTVCQKITALMERALEKDAKVQVQKEDKAKK